MPKLKNLLTLAALATLALTSAANAGWLYSANSYLEGRQKPGINELLKHPKNLVQTTTAARDAEKPFLCVSYHNTVGQDSKGRVVATAIIFHPNGNSNTLKFAGGVKKNSFLKCKEGPDLEAGAFLDAIALASLPNNRRIDTPSRRR